jgi:acyl-CoA thioester hydrolase, YbgC/YbaW family
MSNRMIPCRHTAQYYETDRMGIIHHSNFIRWMEEARIDFLRQQGIRYSDLEASGLISPIFEVGCRYKRMVKFEDTVSIVVSVAKYTGVKLILSYLMINETTGEVCAEGESTSCFMNTEGKLISLKKEYPVLHTLFENLIHEPD